MAATSPQFKGCAVVLQCFEPGGHAIFEEAAPSYKARHMWMAGLERDEAAFDRLVAGYDLRGPIDGMSVPWFAEAPRTGLMDDPRRFVVWLYTLVGAWAVPDEELRRVIQEFWYEGCNRAAPRYFNASTFRQEWLDRRERLLAAWTCPVMVLQGREDVNQPREFYEDAREHLPNAQDVKVRYLQAGHFWALEAPDEATGYLRELLAM